MPTIGLVLPTSSYRASDFVAAADELNVDLVVASDASLGIVSGRILEVVTVDCADPEAVAGALVEASVTHPLDAIVGVDDAGVVAAALAAEQLGLPHNDPSAVAATRDKLAMRRRLADGGVPQPRFGELKTDGSPAAIAASVGYPLVVKPVSLSGSRGVIRADDEVGLEAAVSRIRAIQVEAGIEQEVLLLEEYLEGPEIAIEGLVSAVGLEVFAVFDKPDPLEGPFFEETLYVTPSRHQGSLLAEAGDVVEEAIRALGLVFGPIHAEVRLTPEGPRIIEIAARSIGGLCGRSLKFGMLAQSLEVQLLRAALGLNRRGMRVIGQASGAMMIPIPDDGVFRGVGGRAAVAEVEGIEEITITIPLGRRIRRLPEADRYLGFIIARGASPDDVEASLREAHGLLSIEIE
ncbi:MAG: ATP-grasp domain-containing protein [Acidobacteria bacterium]|nr:ATP-grasp domain-containing protein [Acidobacteriota bacterium]